MTLSSAVVYGDDVKVSYTKPSSNPLQTSTGSQAASIDFLPVINNSLVTDLIYLNSVVENVSPDTLTIDYNLTLSSTPPPVSSFEVTVNDSKPEPIESIITKGKSVKIKLANGIKAGDKVRFSYTKPTSKYACLQCVAGNMAPSVYNQPVINNVTEDVLTRVEKEIDLKDNIKIYPNPAHGFYNISFAESYIEPIVVRIINFSGAIVSEEVMEAGSVSSQFQLNLSSGIYLMQFISGKIITGTQKLIVK